MKQKCRTCQQEKFIVARGLCSTCLLADTVSKGEQRRIEALIAEQKSARPVNAVDPTKQATPRTNGVSKVDTGKLLVCDGCDKEFKTLSSFGKLNLCVECKTREHNAAIELQEYDPKNYKTWPRCNTCHAHVVKEQLNEQDGMCFKCAQSKRAKVDSLSVKPTDSNKYQEFFNQEAQSITDMFIEKGTEQGILELRQWIIDSTEALFSQEAQAFQTKSRLQCQKVKYNDILSTLSQDEQTKLRIEDHKYKSKSGAEPRKLKSPLAQAEKTKKLKKSLEEQINSWFGGTLTAEEIEEKKRALGM